MPMTAIIARRPFAISALSFFFRASGSSMPFAPGTPSAPAVSKSPGPRRGSYTNTFFSKEPQKAMIWHQPKAGTLDSAARPFGTSANETPADGEQKPGHRKYSGTMYPMHANMATRPCWISMMRRRRNWVAATAGSGYLARPRGSQKPSGGHAPSCVEMSSTGAFAARSGESPYRAQSPQAWPVRPFWKNMPMMAIMASLPLLISASSFFSLVSLSAMLAPPGRPRAPKPS
mmetsp:Transcript_103974/g.279379  ORF Transcript_103974/g.279379 Transcript_103974/m.279379 type:complete len:231 (-) Transcript_103974:194-886(-)